MGLPGLTIEHPNFRTAPDLSSQVIRVLNPNTSVEVFEKQGEYWRVLVEGESGFVHQDFVVPNPGGPVSTDETVVTEMPAVQAKVAADCFAANQGFATAPLACGEEQQLPGSSTVGWIWNQYGGLLSTMSSALGIDPGTAVAVLAIESGGRAFSNGRMVIRFENHIFNQFWGRNNPSTFAQHFSFDAGATWQGHHWRPDPNQEWRSCHTTDQQGEWEVFEFASTLDETAAKLSISMGLTQIMGFNHRTIGYDSVLDMFEAFSADARYQVLGFFDFVRVNGGVGSLQAGDFAAFARMYNGPGMVDHYAGLMNGALARFRELRG
jgi:hypothetical protein